MPLLVGMFLYRTLLSALTFGFVAPNPCILTIKNLTLFTQHAVEVPSSFAGISTAIHQSPVAALDVRELKPTPKGALLDADVVDLRNLFRFLTKTEDEDTSQSAEEEEVPDRLELLQKSGFMEYLQTPREVYDRNLNFCLRNFYKIG